MIGALQLPLWLAIAAPSVAVVPTATAEAANPATLTERATVGVLVRSAVADVAAVRAISGTELERLVTRAQASGIRCDTALPDCAARIGAFGSIDFMLLPSLSGDTVTLALVDCADGRVVRAHSTQLADERHAWKAQLTALTRAALGIAPPPPVALPATTPEKPIESAAPAAVAPPPERVLARVGVGALVVGALFAVGGGVGAAVVAPTPDSRTSTTAREYNDAVTAGRVLLLVSAAGLVLGGAGAAAWLVNDEGAP